MNKMENISPVCNLVGLKTLILGNKYGGNPLKTIPDEIKNLVALEKLHVQCCELDGLPVMKDCAALLELNVRKNALTCAGLEKFFAAPPPQLTELDLQCQEIAKGFSSQKTLKEIPDVSELQSLTKLNISWNKELTQLDESVGGLVALTTLIAHNCALKEIPDISGLQRLEDLSLRRNNITVLHPSVGSLTALKKLDCSENQIAELPDLSKLGLLKLLDVRWNRLAQEQKAAIQTQVQSCEVKV